MKLKDIKNIDVKKALLVVFVLALVGYVFWDLSVKARSHFWMEGYESAIEQVFKQGNNEDCNAFNIFSEEEELVLVNVECLQMGDEMGEEGMMMEEMPEEPREED